MATGTISLLSTTTSNGATSATVRITMTYVGNGETWNSSPASNNCQITLNGTTKYFTHGYTTSQSPQTMGYADFTISKTHNSQSLTATGKLTGYSTVYSDPTATCTVSVSAKTSYQVSYSGNHQTGGTLPSNQTKWYGESLTLATNNLTRTGYTANGWNTKTDGTGASYANGASYTTNAALALYAKWTINSYVLTANANGGTIPSTSGWTGTGATATKAVNYNSAYGTLPTPTRSNYNFLGWFTNSSGGTQVTSNTIMGAQATPIYAQWSVAYTPLAITYLSCTRRENDNTKSDIIINWRRGSDNTGTLHNVKIRARYKTGTGDWTYATDIIGGSSSTESWISFDDTSTASISIQANTTAETQYTVEVTLYNDGYSSYQVSKTDYISATFFTIDINATGTGIGLLTAVADNAQGIYIGGDLNLNSGYKYKCNGIETAANLIPYMRNTRGNLDWTGTGEGDTKAITKSALAYWNGAYDGTNGSNLVYCSTGKIMGPWILIGSGSNPTNAISFSDITNYNEVMIVADIERLNVHHLLTVSVPAARISANSSSTTEIKLGGGQGVSSGTNCGAWGEITTTSFTPVAASINNTDYKTSTSWYIYAR